MGNRIKNISIELDEFDEQIKAHDVILNNLNTDYVSWQNIESADSVELYKYIVDLRSFLFEGVRFIKHEYRSIKNYIG